MKIKVRIAVMSHLSDAEEFIRLGKANEAHQQIEFTKKLILKYPDLDVEVENDELNALWYDDLSVDRTI